MSSWWETSEGEDLTENVSKEYDAGGGDFEIIPAKTKALAYPATAAWAKDRDGNRYINIQWRIAKPEEYANRVVFQKLWCDDDDPRAKDPAKKRDKAKKMLAAIDANAGGKLAKAGREPDDDDLALALTNKQMGVLINVWEMDGKEGNWIAAIYPKAGLEVTVPPKQAVKKAAGKAAFDDDLDDSEIPF